MLRVRHYSHVTESFPLLQARTRRFTLGAPTDFTISPDGERVAFLQSTSATDPVKRLMIAQVADPFVATAAADPGALLTGSEEVSPAEKARRERLRESGAGIVSYSTDEALTVAAFGLSGFVGVANLGDDPGESRARLLDVAGPAIDPQVDPTGSRVAWVADGSLYVAALSGDDERCLLESTGPTHSWGLANFLAAEEFDRVRGFWWAPDGSGLLVEEVDEAGVDEWFIADPAVPSAPPRSVRYPAVGRPNPQVRLWLVPLAGERHEIGWDRNRWEYLVSVRWNRFGPALVTLFDRLQQQAVVLAVDPADGTTHQVSTSRDDAWVSMLPGTPTWTAGGELVTTHQSGFIESIAIDGTEVELLPDHQVTAVLKSGDCGLLVAVAPRATASSLVLIDPDGTQHALTHESGWTAGTYRSGTLLTVRSTIDTCDWTRELWRWNPGDEGPQHLSTIESYAMSPPLEVQPHLLTVGERNLNVAVLWPSGHELGSVKLPVIMNPYGGPHAQRVYEVGRAYSEAQWIADQGFAVIIADGRGSPGRGPAWERTINGDLATFPLQDQIDALHGVARRWPADIDLDRVGITGWSFGGYLAALAVLRRPDVFHAAVAGAPVTEWRLYDSAYTERYLGDPIRTAENYDASSLLPLAPNLERPLMIIHGFADDNVLVAHSVQLSAALTAAGRPHTFLPLANVTHMTPQEEVAENLLKLEVEFFTRNLLGKQQDQ
jgi:dipeptidyl-peptidase-4